MTTEQRANERENLRKKNIDIEVTVITTSEGAIKHTGKYRFLVSFWNENRFHIRNYYSPNAYDSYILAEEAAIIYAENYLNT